jgi:hypothetical protein
LKITWTWTELTCDHSREETEKRENADHGREEKEKREKDDIFWIVFNNFLIVFFSCK